MKQIAKSAFYLKNKIECKAKYTMYRVQCIGCRKMKNKLKKYAGGEEELVQ